MLSSMYFFTITNSMLLLNDTINSNSFNNSRFLNPKMRNNRSPSFQNQYSHSPSHAAKKYYTRQEVSAILQATLESKLSKIYKQLEQKQQIIRQLNQRLNRNDQALQYYASKSKQFVKYHENDMQQITTETINALINEKLQNMSKATQKSLDKIRVISLENSKVFQQMQQQKIDKKLTEIRQICEQNVGVFKKKNNAYWNKVKETLAKIHNRLAINQEKMNNIGKQLTKYEHERNMNEQMLRDLSKGTNSAKMLVQLKKSVNNVYKNFEEVLKLQEIVRDHFVSNNMNDGGSICLKCSNKNSNPELNSDIRNKGISDDFVVLQYSIEEEQNKRKYQKSDPYQFGATEPMRKQQSYSLKKNYSKPTMYPTRPASSHKKIQPEHQNNLMYSHDNYYAKNDNFEMYSPITNKSSNVNESRQIQPRRKLLKSYQDCLSSDSFQFNYTAHNNSTGINQSSQGITSFMNFTLETRKENIQTIRNRLQELIEIKNYSRPLRVYVDHINYLKNQQGNYLFDLKGNMFKVSPQHFSHLQSEGVLQNIIKLETGNSSRMKPQ